jgi:hypothetical protein
VIFSLFLSLSGCSEKTIDIEKVEKSNPNAKLALIQTPGKSGTYRIKTISQRKVSIEGPVRKNAMAFEGGQSNNKVEILFDSHVKSINSDGNALETITIKELKYFSEVRNKTVLDFDSLKDKDPNNALFALIGQSYTIEVTSSGQVVKVSDTDKVLGDIKDIPSNRQAARGLISENTIKKRHTVPLPDVNDNELEAGKTWSNVKSFNFDEMGLASFKRTYKLEKIKKDGGNLNAIISMSAIPSAESSTPSRADVRTTYAGLMEMDVITGTLLKYQENLENKWVIAWPNSDPEGSPSVLKMTATKSYDIEKIN